jgi:hypothetical protein
LTPGAICVTVAACSVLIREIATAEAYPANEPLACQPWIALVLNRCSKHYMTRRT